MEENIILNKSFNFAVRIIKLYQYLVKNKIDYSLLRQILRSGTSIGANIEEAHGGVSKQDFSAKIAIAYKEVRETKYWLRLFHETNIIEEKVFNSLFCDSDELGKIIFTVLKKTRYNK